MELTSVALDLVATYGPLALFLFTFLESSMLFPFLPSEVVVPAAAAVLVADLPSLVAFVLVAGFGATVGAFVPYYAFSHDRITENERLRRWIRVSDDRIERGQAWFRRWGQSSVLWGRFLPVLRSVVSIPAALAAMEARRFGVYTAVGSAGFYAATGGLVYYGRQESLFEALVAAATARPALTVALVVVLVGIALLVRMAWSRRRE